MPYNNTGARISFTLLAADGSELVFALPACFKVCPACEGANEPCSKCLGQRVLATPDVHRWTSAQKRAFIRHRQGHANL